MDKLIERNISSRQIVGFVKLFQNLWHLSSQKLHIYSVAESSYNQSGLVSALRRGLFNWVCGCPALYKIVVRRKMITYY